jgi:hypothetical protein
MERTVQPEDLDAADVDSLNISSKPTKLDAASYESPIGIPMTEAGSAF